jgi:hypothetical protein
VDGVGQGINGVRVVEGLSTENIEQVRTTLKRRAVINAVILLDNPDEFLTRVIEVQLDLVGRRTNRLITSELELLDQILMGVLGHLTTLISVQEYIIYIERSGNERLVVGVGDLLRTSASKLRNCPQALINRAQVKVDLNLVVLEGDQRKGKTGVTAEPELERNIESGLRKGVARSAYLTRGVGVARAIDIREGRISDISKLGGVANHLVVTTLLVLSKGKLVPDVHPVTILTVDTLTTDLNLYLGNKLLTREVQPAGINAASGVLHGLVDLRKSNLQVSAVGKISITGDSASYTTTEIGLTVESLLDRLHSEVSMTTVCDGPESDLWLTS